MSPSLTAQLGNSGSHTSYLVTGHCIPEEAVSQRLEIKWLKMAHVSICTAGFWIIEFLRCARAMKEKLNIWLAV